MIGRSARRKIGSAVIAAFVLVACGDDDDASDETSEVTGASESTTAAPTTGATGTTGETGTTGVTDTSGLTDTTGGSATTRETDSTVAATPAPGGDVSLDTNGDGTVVFGVATPGPRDDGAYYQALVEGVEAFSAEQGFEPPIVVDNIDPAQAETELTNLARQDPDVIAVGASEIGDPLPALTEEFSDIFWYCNCGAGAGENPNLAQTNDDSSEISYTAGYATGLLLQGTESTSAAFLGCCDLDFEVEARMAFELGLQAVDDSYALTYIPTGDFNDVAAASEAFNQSLAEGIGAVYPFLGGSHEAVVQLANENDVITMSAGASDACERDDLDYQIAVQFDAGDYLATIFEQILSGELEEGEVLTFRVGEFPFVGAVLCDATAEQEAALEDVREQILAGELAEQFGQIKAEAYGG